MQQHLEHDMQLPKDESVGELIRRAFSAEENLPSGNWNLLAPLVSLLRDERIDEKDLRVLAAGLRLPWLADFNMAECVLYVLISSCAHGDGGLKRYREVWETSAPPAKDFVQTLAVMLVEEEKKLKKKEKKKKRKNKKKRQGKRALSSSMGAPQHPPSPPMTSHRRTTEGELRIGEVPPVEIPKKAKHKKLKKNKVKLNSPHSYTEEEKLSMPRRCKHHGCKKVFIESENNGKACRYHQGVWYDPLYDDLQWSCCHSTLAHQPGCAVGHHEDDRHTYTKHL